MIYKVTLTEQAKQDLRDIYEYIAFSPVEKQRASQNKHWKLQWILSCFKKYRSDNTYYCTAAEMSAIY